MEQAVGQQHTMSDHIATFRLLDSMNHSHPTRKHAKCRQRSADGLFAAGAAHTEHAEHQGTSMEQAVGQQHTMPVKNSTFLLAGLLEP